MGRLPWAVVRAGPFSPLGRRAQKGRAGWINWKHSASVFQFSEVILQWNFNEFDAFQI
jgi:hypothetical protein